MFVRVTVASRVTSDDINGEVLRAGTVGSGLAEQDVGGVLGIGVLADRGDLAVADGEDADVAVVVHGTAAGGGAGGPLGDDLVRSPARFPCTRGR